MTHEHTEGDEATGGPQADHRLPDATDVPVADGPDDLPVHIDPENWDD